MAPFILNLGERGGGHFTPGNEPRYPLHRRLGGLQGGSGRFAEENAMERGSRPPKHYTEHNFVTEDKDTTVNTEVNMYTRFGVKINKVKLNERQYVRRPRYGLDGPWFDCRNVQTDPGAHTTVLDCLEGVMRPKHKADHTLPSTPRSIQSADHTDVAPCTLSRYVQGHQYLSWLHKQQCHSPARRLLLSSHTDGKAGGGTLLAVFPGAGKSSGDRGARVLPGAMTTRRRGIGIAQLV